VPYQWVAFWTSDGSEAFDELSDENGIIARCFTNGKTWYCTALNDCFPNCISVWGGGNLTCGVLIAGCTHPKCTCTESPCGEDKMDGVKQFQPTHNADIPSNFTLYQNYPNPFNPLTKIVFDIPRAGFVKLEVFNVAGERVAVLVNSTLIPGRHQYEFDATQHASGLYLYKLTAGTFTAIGKMIVLK